MTQLSAQSDWIVLPCYIISFFTTYFLIDIFASQHERGLITVSKAALIFVTTLVLTTKAANSLFEPTAPPTKSPTRNVLHKKRKVSPMTEQRVRPWYENTAPTLRWSSDSEDEVREEVKQQRKKKMRRSRQKRERLDEVSLRKRLSEMFKPKRYQMLGPRRDTVEEVVQEDPLA
jgi:hypothetical protein